MAYSIYMFRLLILLLLFSTQIRAAYRVQLSDLLRSRDLLPLRLPR
jgi:hypothetical protein